MNRVRFVFGMVTVIVLVASISLSARTFMSEVYLNSGIKALHARLYDDAEALCARAVRLSPHSFLPRYYLGATRMGAGKLQEAVDAYRETLLLFPNHVPSLVGAGCAFLKLDDPQQAREYLRMAMELAPEHSSALYYTAVCESKLGKWQEARAGFESALQAGFTQRGELLLNLGVVLKQLGEVREAIPYFDDALEEERENPITNIRAGAFFYEIGEHEKASETLKQGIKLFLESGAKPNSNRYMLEGYHLLAKAFLEQFDDPYRCSAILVELSGSVPQDPTLRKLTDQLREYLVTDGLSTEGAVPAWYQVGVALFRQGRYDEAEQSLTTLIESGKPDARIMRRAYHYLALVMSKKKDYDGALQVIDRGKTIAPDFSALDDLRKVILAEKTAAERSNEP